MHHLLDLLECALLGLGYDDVDEGQGGERDGGEEPVQALLGDVLHGREVRGGDEEVGRKVGNHRDAEGLAAHAQWKDLRHNEPRDGPEAYLVRRHVGHHGSEGQPCIEARHVAERRRAEDQERDEHAERAEHQQHTAAVVVDQEDGNHGGQELDRADTEGIQSRGGRTQTNVLEDGRCIVQDAWLSGNLLSGS